MPARLAGDHRDPAEHKRSAERLERRAEQVALPDRGPADREVEVGVGDRAQGGDAWVELVRERGNAHSLAAPRLDQCGERISRAIVRRAGAERLPRFAKFVAAGDDRDLGPSRDHDARLARSGGKTDRCGAEQRADAKQLLPGGEIHAPGADERRSRRIVDRLAVALAGGIFLHDHPVGAVGNDPAGGDRDALACPDCAREGCPGRCFADQPKNRPLRDIGRAHRKSVHRRHRRGRLVVGREERRGEGSPCGVPHPDLLASKRPIAREQQPQRLLEPDRRGHARVQRPDLPPRFSTSSMRSIEIPRAALLSMS